MNNQDYTLDKTDRKIIGLLAGDSRLSYARIGSALHLTRNSIKTRVKRMISIGVLIGIVIRIVVMLDEKELSNILNV